MGQIAQIVNWRVNVGISFWSVFIFSQFRPQDSQGGYRQFNKPQWPDMTWYDLEMTLEYIFFSAYILLSPIQ